MMNTPGSLNNNEKADRIEVEYFTDPLCCWSWAFEPHWRQFVNENASYIHWNYRMGGLITDWDNYNDPLNDISRPAHMAPLWLQVKYTTNTDIDPDIWIEDPPYSSLPACMAVKCAEAQSKVAADILLLYLRKGVMTQKLNIGRRDVIFKLAKEVSEKFSILAYEKFESDFENNRLSNSLLLDLQKTKQAGIGRFPTVTMRLPGQSNGIMLIGYRPHSVLSEAFKQLIDVYAGQF